MLISKLIHIDWMSHVSTVNAEISIVPIGTSDTSMSKEIAAAYDAIRNLTNLKK